MQIKDIIYLAAVLQHPEVIDEKYFKHPIKFAHHCTIQFGNIENIPEFVGKEVNFITEYFFNDNNASAFSGYLSDDEIKNLMTSNNQHCHVTLSCEPGIRPVYSNTLIRVTKPVEKIENLILTCKIGVFCSFYDGKTDWIF